MTKACPSRLALLLCGTLFACQLGGQERVREPLPLDVGISLNNHLGRSSFNLSPDGQWLAHSWATDENVLKGGTFTRTGVSGGDGFDRKQAGLTNVKTGQTILLGRPENFNWAPVWSPDGNRVAYFSDEGGEAGVWIWEKVTNKTWRFPGVIARSFFGFEIVRWSMDSQRLLCKILPEGMTISEANSLLPSEEKPDRFPRTGPNEPSVIVYKSPTNQQVDKSGTADLSNRELGDLAILDLRTHRVTRIASRLKSEWWEFSPDGKYVGYTATLGWELTGQQPIHQIAVYDLATGQTRMLAAKIHLNYGIEVSWSPDSSRIAYIDMAGAKGQLVIMSIADGATRTLSTANMPSFSQDPGCRPPLWDLAAENLYLDDADGKLWRFEVASGRGTAISDIPEHRIGAIVARAGKTTIWTTGSGRTAWVVAHESSGKTAGIFRVDLASGRTSAALEDNRAYADIFNLDANDETGEIAYVAEDQQHLQDAYIFDTSSGRSNQATHLNERIEHYELGLARLINWYSFDGQKLSGTLLLPPSYRQGQRLPLVIWVYGGRNGSTDLNRFGLWGEMPLFNFHILATRGYAVLEPDAPLRQGMQMRDLMATVSPGVDAAIEQGFADPDRLAVMGQSYGSYSVLALITQTTRFKAAVITGAVMHPDLVADYLNTDPESPSFHTGFYEQGQGNLGGTPWDHRDRYLDNSPIYLFDRVETPLLIGQGNKDSFGHNQLPSDAIFAALKRLGKNVEYRIYKDENHVLFSKPNVIDFWQRRLDFLAEHLNLATDAQGAIVFEGDRAKSAKAE